MKIWISNTHDPKDPYADVYVARSFDETQEQAVRHYREWLRGKYIGKPRASKAYSVKQMRDMGLVGVYIEGSIFEWLKRLFKGWL